MADLLSLFFAMFHVFVSLSHTVSLVQEWYCIVTIPDLYLLLHFSNYKLLISVIFSVLKIVLVILLCCRQQTCGKYIHLNKLINEHFTNSFFLTKAQIILNEFLT